MHAKWSLGFGLAMGVALAVHAADMGRQAVGKDAGSVPVVQDYRGAMTETGPGLEASLDWSMVDWDAGDASFSDSVFVPGVAFSYGLGQWADIRFTARYATLDDGAGDLDLLRLGVGSRLWIDLESDVVPYAGLGLNYYLLDSDAADDVDGTIGLSAEAGVAYLLGEFTALRAGIQLESTLQDAEAEVGDETVDVSLSAFSFGLGLQLLF